MPECRESRQGRDGRDDQENRDDRKNRDDREKHGNLENHGNRENRDDLQKRDDQQNRIGRLVPADLQKPSLEEKLKSLPEQPGVYLMKDAEGKVIYVGKAVILKNRVRSYFQNSAGHSPKVRAMVAKIADLEYILTDSEVEALILECNLIKKHHPNYNIMLRDDKQYPYLKVTINEEFPRVMITRNVRRDQAKYYGPFTSSGAVQETLKLLKKLFPLRTCKKAVLVPNGRPCLNHHIKRCMAPCAGLVSKEVYAGMVREICLFLEGRQDTLIKELEKKMQEAAEAMEFERAAVLRDQINALNKVVERQKIVAPDHQDRDIIAMARGIDEVCVVVFFVRCGKLNGRQPYFLEGADDLRRSEVITAFVKQYYSQVEFIPAEVLLGESLEEAEVISAWLREKRGGKVVVQTPKRGTKKELVEMAAKNALQELEQRSAQLVREKERTEGAVLELQKYLGLEVPPWRMECYDISNTQGTESVGSMVVFEGGKPSNKLYRRFRIKTVEGPNDFASMQEVLGRRFKRAAAVQAVGPADQQVTVPDQGQTPERTSAPEQVSEQTSAPQQVSEQTSAPEQTSEITSAPQQTSVLGPWTLPDLIIIDGGKGQLSAAREVMHSLGFSGVPTFGLAKEEELLFTEGRSEPIILPRGSKALYLVQRIRDEAHRFALEYHRSLRGKRNLHSVLEDIPGIGSKRKQALYKHFGSLAKIRNASPEELAAVPGMTMTSAREVWEFFQSE